MNITIVGAAGFIGTNLVKKLAQNNEINITVIDKEDVYFDTIRSFGFENVKYEVSKFETDENYEELLKNTDVLFHLLSTTSPSNSNQFISDEIRDNVIVTSRILDACVKVEVQKVIFLSSGGTVYGKHDECPLSEDMPTDPITSYGIQKITIEKLLYLYNYMYNLDYRIFRLSNPYGPYQRPNGKLGVVTTFVYRAVKNEPLNIYGDGSIVRDFIYIDDAVAAIVKASFSENSLYKLYNIGSGSGISIKELIECIKKEIAPDAVVNYEQARKVDVPENFLNVKRFEAEYGKINRTNLTEGIQKTADFFRQ